MKKSLAVIALAMVAALALCLIGCGGKMPKDEMLKQSEELDLKAFDDAVYGMNEKAGKDQFDGKIVTVYGAITDCEGNKATIAVRKKGTDYRTFNTNAKDTKNFTDMYKTNREFTMYAELSQEDIDKYLTTHNTVENATVVGRIKFSNKKDDKGYVEPSTLENAYIVDAS